MGKTADNDNQDSSSSHCFCRISLLCVAAFFVPSVVFIHFGLSPFLVTISILCLSTIFLLTVAKRKYSSVKNPPENQQVEKKLSPKMEAVTMCNAAQQSEVSDFHDYQVETTDCPSVSESSDDFSANEGFELNWACFNNLGKNVAVSEILGSDEEEVEDEDDNLIEISFPDNTSCVELTEESEKELQIDFAFNEETEAKVQMELPESMFRREGFMELLKEINEVTEEENLIEIDLSMGSIKGQNF